MPPSSDSPNAYKQLQLDHAEVRIQELSGVNSYQVKDLDGWNSELGFSSAALHIHYQEADQKHRAGVFHPGTVIVLLSNPRVA